MRPKTSNDALNRLSPAEFRAAQKRSIVVVLDNVRSLHNVGSAFRTADAFLIHSIVLCGITGTPPDREIEKTALGATQTVAWRHEKSTTDALLGLREEGYLLYAVEQATGSVALNDFKRPQRPLALIFGNEVYGVSQEAVDLCDGVIEIPQGGSKHSLNVAVSIGVVLWELVRDQPTS